MSDKTNDDFDQKDLTKARKIKQNAEIIKSRSKPQGDGGRTVSSKISSESEKKSNKSKPSKLIEKEKQMTKYIEVFDKMNKAYDNLNRRKIEVDYDENETYGKPSKAARNQEEYVSNDKKGSVKEKESVYGISEPNYEEASRKARNNLEDQLSSEKGSEYKQRLGEKANRNKQILKDGKKQVPDEDLVSNSNVNSSRLSNDKQFDFKTNKNFEVLFKNKEKAERMAKDNIKNKEMFRSEVDSKNVTLATNAKYLLSNKKQGPADDYQKYNELKPSADNFLSRLQKRPTHLKTESNNWPEDLINKAVAYPEQSNFFNQKKNFKDCNECKDMSKVRDGDEKCKSVRCNKCNRLLKIDDEEEERARELQKLQEYEEMQAKRKKEEEQRLREVEKRKEERRIKEKEAEKIRNEERNKVEERKITNDVIDKVMVPVVEKQNPIAKMRKEVVKEEPAILTDKLDDNFLVWREGEKKGNDERNITLQEMFENKKRKAIERIQNRKTEVRDALKEVFKQPEFKKKEEKQETPVDGPNPALIERLINGEKAKMNEREMKEVNKRLYEKLVLLKEVKEDKDALRTEENLKRKQEMKEYSKKIRKGVKKE